MQQTTLPLARYRFGFRMQSALDLPEYAGSLLRGQFGASLRQISCMTQAPECQGCTLRATCPYPAIFEAPGPAQHALQNFSHIPNAYVIEPPPFGTRRVQAGGMLQFNVVLFGRALQHLPLVSFALQHALKNGLGQTRAKGVLQSIEVQHNSQHMQFQPVWQAGDAAIAAHDTAYPIAASHDLVRRITLEFHTPLRLQNQGKPLQADQLTPRKLVANLLRRATLLAEFHADCKDLVLNAPELVRQAESLSQQTRLRWQDWSRYSSRQQREMTLGGVLGAWTLEGPLQTLLPWLELGQWLHVGKNATLGMGAYTITEAV